MTKPSNTPPTTSGDTLPEDAPPAVAQEATDAPIRIVWKDVEFTLSRHFDDWTGDFIRALRTGDIYGVAVAALADHPAQLAAFEAHNPRGADYRAIHTAVTEALGADQGE